MEVSAVPTTAHTVTPETGAGPETVPDSVLTEAVVAVESPANHGFQDHLLRVRAHRSELRDSVAAVDLALESPIARGGAWRERVRAALAELAHDFDDHIALTESRGGIYDRAKRTAPRLGGAVERLLAEHRQYREQIHGYLAVLEHGGQLADMPAFREELTALLGRLVRHRQAGGDLVYEAYEVDLGGSG